MNEDESETSSLPVNPSTLIESLSGFRDVSCLIKSCMTLSSWKIVSGQLRPFQTSSREVATKSMGNIKTRNNNNNLMFPDEGSNSQIEIPSDGTGVPEESLFFQQNRLPFKGNVECS
jgi:hypothetical protein